VLGSPSFLALDYGDLVAYNGVRLKSSSSRHPLILDICISTETIRAQQFKFDSRANSGIGNFQPTSFVAKPGKRQNRHARKGLTEFSKTWGHHVSHRIREMRVAYD
jgi:hypothetical protein